MLISIVTICLNSEKNIIKCIESVVNQDYKNIEYILIDGGSVDSTVAIIESYKNRYNFIKYISEKDSGISDAFNKGINLCSGDLIGIINSDDWLEQNILTKIARVSEKADIIHGNLQYWTDGVKGFLFVPNISGIRNDMTINHPTVFIKSKIYKSFGGFKLDYKYAMDYELILRFYLYGVKFHYLNETISNMNLNGVSDKFWFKAIIESRKAKLENGLSFINSSFYMIFQIIRSFTSRALSNLGLNTIVKFYRSNVSNMKKYKYD